jgi:hypothetical protein
MEEGFCHQTEVIFHVLNEYMLPIGVQGTSNGCILLLQPPGITAVVVLLFLSASLTLSK